MPPLRTALRLSHWSPAPIGKLHDVPQFEASKPSGLWVSVDGEYGWPEWNVDNEYSDLDARHRYRVTLAGDADILWLTEPDQLHTFSRLYPADDGAARRWGDLVGMDPRFIDWPAVAARHQGIIITPYQWECRMETLWYYGWDCASGCIWDSSAISELSEVDDRV